MPYCKRAFTFDRVSFLLRDLCYYRVQRASVYVFCECLHRLVIALSFSLDLKHVSYCASEPVAFACISLAGVSAPPRDSVRMSLLSCKISIARVNLYSCQGLARMCT